MNLDVNIWQELLDLDLWEKKLFQFISLILPTLIFCYLIDTIRFLVLLQNTSNSQQSVAFPDMVIALQVENEVADDDFTGFWCEEHPIHIDRRVATRPVLASLLQTIWGMSKTYRYFINGDED